MRSIAIPAATLLFLLTVTGCATEGPAPEAAEQPVAELSQLAPGWNTIEGGGETTCSDGSPWSFFVRPGDPEKLAVYFQGGGGCWNGGTCDPDLQPSYTVNLEGFDPSRYDGIFAFDQPENPLADYSFVFVPYCTGDVHIGNRVASYEAPDTEEHATHPFEVHHLGAINAEAALDWTYAHFFRPSKVFVSGSSAGSIPSPYYAMLLADHYPDARVAQLGDAAGGYRGIGSTTRPHVAWGTLDHVLTDLPEYRDMAPGDFSFESLYVTAGKRHPEIQLAEYDAAEDEVQKQFLTLGGIEAPSLLELLEANQADIRSEVPNFRSFIAGGDVHTILGRPELYTYEAGGTRFRDWLAELTEGEALADVHCSPCDVAGVVESAPADLPSGGR